MCNKRNTRWITLRNGKRFRVDACIRDLIYSLNSHGFETLACCCGHGKYPITIIYRYKSNDALNGNIYDFCSGWGVLRRKKRYYIKDKRGLYYIPEVQEREGKRAILRRKYLSKIRGRR